MQVNENDDKKSGCEQGYVIMTLAEAASIE